MLLEFTEIILIISNISLFTSASYVVVPKSMKQVHIFKNVHIPSKSPRIYHITNFFLKKPLFYEHVKNVLYVPHVVRMYHDIHISDMKIKSAKIQPKSRNKNKKQKQNKAKHKIKRKKQKQYNKNKIEIKITKQQ